MRAAIGMALILSTCWLAGCGGGSATGGGGSKDVPVADPVLNYSETVHLMVLEIQQSLRRRDGLQLAKGNTDALLENLETYEKAPIGEHKATYEGIYAKAKELKAAFDRSAKPAEINAKVAELVAAADKLPAKATVPERDPSAGPDA